MYSDPETVIEPEENLLEKIDSEKDFFSLQEVVELTLLHAQQVHVLQKHYEHKIDQMNENIESIQKKNEEAIRDMVKKMRNQEISHQRASIALEASMSKRNSVVVRDEVQASAAPSDVSSRPVTPKKKPKQKRSKTPKRGSASPKRNRSKSREKSADKSKKSSKKINVKDPVIIPKGTNAEPKISAAHMSMSVNSLFSNSLILHLVYG